MVRFAACLSMPTFSGLVFTSVWILAPVNDLGLSEFEVLSRINGGDSCYYRANSNCQIDTHGICGFARDAFECNAVTELGCKSCTNDLEYSNCPGTGALYETCDVQRDPDACGVVRWGGCEWDMQTHGCDCDEDSYVETTDDCSRETIVDSSECPF